MAVKTRTQVMERDVSKKKPAKQGDEGEGGEGVGRSAIGKQVGVRLPPDLLADLEFIGEEAGLDLSAVIRMILTQNRGEYVRAARERIQKRSTSN